MTDEHAYTSGGDEAARSSSRGAGSGRTGESAEPGSLVREVEAGFATLTTEDSGSAGSSGADSSDRTPGRARPGVRRRTGSGSDSDPRPGASAFRQVRDVVATVILTVAVLAAATLALGAILVALHANRDNQIVSAVIGLGHRLDGPFADMFTFPKQAVKQTIVNWGIAAVVYLIAGRILERVIRP